MTAEVALIVGGGPGISASCARLFAKGGMRVGVGVVGNSGCVFSIGSDKQH